MDMRALAVRAPSYSRSCSEHAQMMRGGRSAVVCLFVVALLLAPVRSAVSDECDEHSCEAVLNQAQELILASGSDAIASAARASLMLSSANFNCCRRFPPISTRAALVRRPHLLSSKCHTITL
jgi:hypothetical protein